VIVTDLAPLSFTAIAPGGSAAGLPELVTESLADYEAKALTLARNPSLLAALRDRLKQKRTSAPLFDAEGFRRALEEVFIMMHKQA